MPMDRHSDLAVLDDAAVVGAPWPSSRPVRDSRLLASSLLIGDEYPYSRPVRARRGLSTVIRWNSCSPTPSLASSSLRPVAT